jgi:hypothetical protein
VGEHVEGEVPATLGSFVALFRQDSTDQTWDGVADGEDGARLAHPGGASASR